MDRENGEKLMCSIFQKDLLFFPGYNSFVQFKIKQQRAWRKE